MRINEPGAQQGAVAFPDPELAPGGVRRLAAPYTGAVSTLEQPEEPRVRVYPPEEALKRARPLPPPVDLVVEDVPDDEWTAFLEALAEL